MKEEPIPKHESQLPIRKLSIMRGTLIGEVHTYIGKENESHILHKSKSEVRDCHRE